MRRTSKYSRSRGAASRAQGRAGAGGRRRLASSSRRARRSGWSASPAAASRRSGGCLVRLLEPTGGASLRGPGHLTPHRRALRPLRRQMQMVFQDPYSSLNPRKTRGRAHRRRRSRSTARRAARPEPRVPSCSRSSAWRPSTSTATRTSSPAASASASASPARWRSTRAVVADEPVSALDVSIQAQISTCSTICRTSSRLTYVFVAHDLAVVRHISDRIAVMYLGKIVELAGRGSLPPADPPLHRGAAVGVPIPDPRGAARAHRARGDVPSPIDPPPAAPSTRAAAGDEIC